MILSNCLKMFHLLCCFFVCLFIFYYWRVIESSHVKSKKKNLPYFDFSVCFKHPKCLEVLSCK